MAGKPEYEALVAKLADLEEVIRALRNQEVDAVVGTKSLLMLRLREAEEQLRRQRDYLEAVVVQRTRDLRELSHRLVDAQEKERASIGNELHDEIGQHLTYATLLIDRASRKGDAHLLDEAKSSVQDAISKIRNLSTMLSPRLLRSAGMMQALISMTQEFTRSANIRIHFAYEGALDAVPPDVALAGYRIVQESLTNVARHSGAGSVDVRLSCREGVLHLEVQDDGSGFDVEVVEHSTGLTGMKERALAGGGNLTIQSKPGEGTLVHAVLPLVVQEVS